MEKIGSFSKTVPTMKNYHFTEKNLMILKMIIRAPVHRRRRRRGHPQAQKWHPWQSNYC